MRKSIFVLAMVLFVSIAPKAAEDRRLEAVRAADDERAAAIMAADRARLNANFSDELRYTHSTGAVDTKSSYIDSIVSGRSKYHLIQFEERNFSFPARGIALEAGRVHMKTSSATGDNDAIFSFLAVWREEKGKWRFLAWQSCKLPPTAPAPAKKP